MVIVTNMGFVNDLFINIPEDVDDSSLDMINNALTSLMEGKSVAELQKTAKGMMEEMQYHGKVFESLLSLIHISRMIVFGLEIMGDIPFRKVMIHGIVRDNQGRKMSKSLGNGIDPREIIDTYGTDALRFSLVLNNSIESDMRFYYEKVESCLLYTSSLRRRRFFHSGIILGQGPAGEIDPPDLDPDNG